MLTEVWRSRDNKNSFYISRHYTWSVCCIENLKNSKLSLIVFEKLNWSNDYQIVCILYKVCLKWLKGGKLQILTNIYSNFRTIVQISFLENLLIAYCFNCNGQWVFSSNKPPGKLEKLVRSSLHFWIMQLTKSVQNLHESGKILKRSVTFLGHFGVIFVITNKIHKSPKLHLSQIKFMVVVFWGTKSTFVVTNIGCNEHVVKTPGGCLKSCKDSQFMLVTNEYVLFIYSKFCRKTLWMIFFSVACALMMYQVAVFFIDVFSFPVYLKLYEKSLEKTQFPIITGQKLHFYYLHEFCKKIYVVYEYWKAL